MIVYSSETPTSTLQHNPVRLWIVSFGSDSDYVSIASDTLSRLHKLYPYSSCLIYEVDDLPDDIIAYAKTYRVGYGYWQWKPWLVNETLEKMNEGDVLLYVDGRCGMPRRSIDWLDSMFDQNANNTEGDDFVAWMLNETEHRWTTGDLFEKFNLSVNSSHRDSFQFAATFFALRLNKRTSNFINDWHSFMKDNPEFCRDEVSKIANHSDFLNNRHDQSVFSLMLKRYSSQGLRLRTLTNKDIQNGRSIIPHDKPHPGKIQPNSAIRYIKRTLKRIIYHFSA